MRVEVEFPSVYEPLDDAYRYKVMYGGRAAARSWTIGRKLLLRGTQQKMLILCTRELQKSIKDSVHRLLRDQIEMMGLSGFYTATNNSIKGANGTEFIFLGLKHNTEEIKSTEGVDICWIEEGHAVSEGSWDLIDPTIRKAGSEIWVSFNTRFKFDHIYQLFVGNEPPPASFVIKTTYRDNPFLPDVLKSQLEHQKETDYEKYLHIWEGELKQLAEGAIFGAQVTKCKQDGRQLSIPIQSNCEVDTFWDLGKNDQTAIWFMQRVGMEYRFLDYYEGRQEDIEHYTRKLKDFGYLYGRHYLPHDADHDRLGMTRNIREQLEDGGVKPTEIVPRIKEKNTAIQMGRDIFSLCWFHKGDDERGERMSRGWETLCNYRYKYNEEDDVFHRSPHHDWASNGADAFMQFAQSAPPPISSEERMSERRKKAIRRNTTTKSYIV